MQLPFKVNARTPLLCVYAYVQHIQPVQRIQYLARQNIIYQQYILGQGNFLMKVFFDPRQCKLAGLTQRDQVVK